MTDSWYLQIGLCRFASGLCACQNDWWCDEHWPCSLITNLSPSCTSPTRTLMFMVDIKCFTGFNVLHQQCFYSEKCLFYDSYLLLCYCFFCTRNDGKEQLFRCKVFFPLRLRHSAVDTRVVNVQERVTAAVQHGLCYFNAARFQKYT